MVVAGDVDCFATSAQAVGVGQWFNLGLVLRLGGGEKGEGGRFRMSWTFSRVLCSATRKQLWDEGRRWMSSATSMGSFSNSSGKMSDSGSDTATPSSSSAADSGVKGEEKTAHFGFEEVPFDEKVARDVVISSS